MFLVITEFGEAYEAETLSEDEFSAANDGYLDIYRSDGPLMRWTSDGWSALPTWGDPS